MKKLILSIFILISFNAFPQTYRATINQSLNGTPPSTLDVSFYLQHIGGTSPILGDCSFYINYNSIALNNPILLSDGEWDFDHNSGYDHNIITKGSGIIAIEVVLAGTPTFQIPEDTTLLGIVRFNILDTTQNSNVSWNLTFTEINNSDDIPIEVDGDFVNPGDFLLPVELNSFTAKSKGKSIELLWQTKTEINNFGFEIERKSGSLQKNINNWEKISFVEGNGNSNSTKNYSFTDKNPVGGSKFIYRLKQIDSDGTFAYSDEIEIELIPDNYELFQNYPNPFNPVTNIKFSLPHNTKVRLDVYNILGENVITLINKEMEAGFHSIPFNAMDLSSGTYIYRIQAEGFSQTKKMLLIK